MDYGINTLRVERMIGEKKERDSFGGLDAIRQELFRRYPKAKRMRVVMNPRPLNYNLVENQMILEDGE